MGLTMRICDRFLGDADAADWEKHTWSITVLWLCRLHTPFLEQSPGPCGDRYAPRSAWDLPSSPLFEEKHLLYKPTLVSIMLRTHYEPVYGYADQGSDWARLHKALSLAVRGKDEIHLAKVILDT